MNKQAHEVDVAIVGGGMVGMTLALTLARQGIRVAVVEKTALPSQLEPSFDGRVSAIAEGSRRVLAAAGAWDAMAPHAEPILDIRVSDGDTPFFLHYDHREVGHAPFGSIVENRHIRHALQQVAEGLPALAVFDNAALESFERDAAGVTLRLQGKAIRARLLVGADGKNSAVRKEAGIGATQWSYQQTAIVCTIAHEQPHGGLAQERFLPAGPFAVLPMKPLARREMAERLKNDSRMSFSEPFRGEDNYAHRSSLVWVEPNDRVQLYLDLPEDEFAQEIRERAGDYPGAIRTAGPRFSYPLSLMHAKSYVAERLALIGDAAHAIHPIAGQGVNLGFRDVAVLSELIGGRFRLGLDIGGGDMLSHYQRWRRFDNVAMLAVTDGLNRLFSNNSAPVKLARGLGLWAVGKLPPLKRFFMQDAMGLAGDIPEIIKKFG